MHKWTEKAESVKSETRDALQTVWNATNKGQRQKLLRNEKIAALMKRYEVNVDDER